MQKIVVSLTSYPKRINLVNNVIESIWKQKVSADEIILYLSLMEFPKKEENLPSELVRMIGKNGFRIEWVRENLKSHKKYFYVMQSGPSDIIITIDDDVIYSDTLISDLICSYNKFPNAISARRVRMILKREERLARYNEWYGYLDEYADMPREDLCAIGVGGVLYPPMCTTERWFDEKNIRKLSENQDDLWLKYNEIIDHVPVVYTKPTQNDISVTDAEVTALFTRNMYGGENDICIISLMDKLRREFGEVFSIWFRNLMYIEEFIIAKNKYYREKVEEIFLLYEQKDIYIFGNGQYAHCLLNFIKKCEKEQCIQAFLVSKKNQDNEQAGDIPVMLIDELEENESFAIICGVSEKYKKEVRQSLERFQFHSWIDINLKDITKLEQLEEAYGSVT